MKRLLVLVLAIGLTLSISLTADAASIGSPKTQSQGSIAFSLDADYIFDREMKYKSGDSLATGDEVKDNEIDGLYRLMLKTSYALLENLDVYAKLGISGFDEFKSAYYNGGVKTVDITNTDDNAFAYGAGMRAAYQYENGLILGVDVQYIRHKNDGTNKEEATAGWVSESSEITFQEWHAAPYIAKELGNFIPYLGVKYSDLKMETKLYGRKPKHEADNNVGVFVGADYNIDDAWSLNLEGRFVDETAVSAACTYKF